MGNGGGRNFKSDPTIWAIPGFFATMALEAAWYRRHPERAAEAGAYEAKDTRTSLTMGTLSILAPLALPVLLRPLNPLRGRLGKALLGTVAASALAASASDAYLRRREAAGGPAHEHDASAPAAPTPKAERVAEAVRAVAGPVAVGGGAVAAASTLSTLTNAEAMFKRRLLPDLGQGALPFSIALVGWDFLYYWSHRLQHEHRYLWAVHVVHHSSEHYNLSTALRQPVAESLAPMVPYGVISLLGVRPSYILKARGINLIYQYWVHTEAIETLGVGEEFLSTPSAHRVHHGSNAGYLDRNHGGILIIWDRIFGTFQREGARPTYGLTKNINSFNPWKVASHEFRAILADVARATSWRERLGYVVGPPGWKPTIPATAEVVRPVAGSVGDGGMAERTNAPVLKTGVA